MAMISMKYKELRKQRAADRDAGKVRTVKAALAKLYAAPAAEKDWSEIERLQAQLEKLASEVQVTLRCRVCGRPHGTYRKFGLCRIHLREEAMRGNVPGLRKASW